MFGLVLVEQIFTVLNNAKLKLDFGASPTFQARKRKFLTKRFRGLGIIPLLCHQYILNIFLPVGGLCLHAKFQAISLKNRKDIHDLTIC